MAAPVVSGTIFLLNQDRQKEAYIPNLAGAQGEKRLTKDEAIALLDKLKFKYEIIEEFNEEVPKGEVIKQDPKFQPNYMIKTGTVIKVYVSKGLEMVKVPDELDKKTVDEIKKALDRTFIFDGAHNAAGAESFGMTYHELFGDTPKTMVMAILSDKDEMGIIHEVVKPKDTVIAVAAPTPRTEVPEKLVETVRQCVKGVVAQTEDSVSSALDLALQSTQDGDIIVVCGSLYILGEARGWLQNRMSH